MHRQLPIPASLGAIAASLMAIAGCSEASFMASEQPDTGPPDTGDLTETGTPPAANPTWLAFDGTATLTDGALENLALTVSTFDATQQPLCTGEVAVLGVSDADFTDPDVAINSWWAVTPDAVATPCPGLPPTFGIGLGEWDTRLDAPATTAGYDPTTLNALYLQVDTQLWVMGLGGTDAQLDGTGAVQPPGPLADGTYALASLFLIPAYEE